MEFFLPGESHGQWSLEGNSPWGCKDMTERLTLSLSYVKYHWIFPYCVHAPLLSRVWVFATPWTVACQVPLSMGFPRQEYWCGLPLPPPGDLPDPGIEPGSLTSLALAGGFFTTSATWEAHACLSLFKSYSYSLRWYYHLKNRETERKN